MVIRNLLEGLSVISGLIYPVMPDTAVTMQKHLGRDHQKPFYYLNTLKQLNMVSAGTKLPKSVALFPRIDQKKTNAQPVATAHKDTSTPPKKPEIVVDDLEKIDLRVATITHAEPVPRAKKLLKLEVDLGEKRTILAGISESYSPEELVGKQIIVVANLKPAKMMGILSNGMMLAAIDNKRLAIVTLDKTVAPGTQLS